ncbi:hypothetical protein AB0F77_09485 [Streptomyces sp. NPDC026672]|uniref:hypothetical protein n=1 Tax=unclassified Streptomyces TaxID=2593676 RepID=UPI0033E911D7
MTPPAAALPGAATRVLRTVAGRRALQLAVLMGGLLALGLLSGERAHAADGTTTSVRPGASVPSERSARSVSSVRGDGPGSLTKGLGETVAGLTRSVGGPAVRHPGSGTGAAPGTGTPSGSPVPSGTVPAPPVRPAPVTHSPAPQTSAPHAPALPPGPVPTGIRSDDLVRSVTDTVVKPVGDVIGTVTTELTRPSEPASSLPTLPGLPGLPGLPTWPETGPTVLLPGLPELPGLSEPPGAPLPAPVVTDPAPRRPGAAHPDVPGTRGRTTDRAVTFGSVRAYPHTAPASTAAGAAHARAPHVARPGHAPSRPAPAGDPDGALGNRSAVDNGASRHLDAHAVTLNDRAPLRFVPGAAARLDASGTRDRYRDIPVFPG